MDSPIFVNSRADLIKMAWAAYRHGMAVGEGLPDDEIRKFKLEKMNAELNCQRIEFPRLGLLRDGIVTQMEIDKVIELMRDVFPLEEGSP
jgi:hypothetical protein